MDIPKPSRELERILRELDESIIPKDIERNQQIGVPVSRHVMKNLIGFALTSYCSLGCVDCGLGAKRPNQQPVNNYIPHDILLDIFSRYSEELSLDSVALHFASDPFDYDFEGHDIVKIQQEFNSFVGKPPFISTSVPVGKEHKVIDILLSIDEGRIQFHKNVLRQIFGKENSNESLEILYNTVRELDRNLDSANPGLRASPELFADRSKMEAYWLEDFWKHYLTTRHIKYWENNPVINRVSVSKSNYHRLKKAFEEHFPGLAEQKTFPYAIVKSANKTMRLIDDNIGNKEQMLDSLAIEDPFSISYLPFKRVKQHVGSKGTMHVARIDPGRYIASPKPVTFLDIIASLTTEKLKDKYKYFTDNPETEHHREIVGRGVQDRKSLGIVGHSGYLITPDDILYIKACKPNNRHPFGYKTALSMQYMIKLSHEEQAALRAS